MKVTKISEIKKDKFFWITISSFALFLALILSEITVFQDQYLSSLYGKKLQLGMGIIVTTISWIAIINLLKNKISKFFWREVVAVILLIAGVCLVPHALTFSLMGVLLILFGLNIYFRNWF